MDLANTLYLGFDVAMTANNLMYCTIGVTLGIFIGVLPGIGPLATIAMLLPITFNLPPVTALIMLSGVYYGAMYGGHITAILINLPGTAAASVICIDGHEMAKNGRAGPALLITTLASFTGGIFATIALAVFAPLLVAVALKFGAAEYFSLMILGLVAAVALAHGSALKGLGMVLMGLLLGIVGIDVNSGQFRFTFGLTGLSDGINFVVLAMGVFGIGEVIWNLEQRKHSGKITTKVRWRDLWLTRDDIKRSAIPILRSTAVGSFLGILPGAGPSISSFMAYSVEKRLSKDPSRFGKGAIEAVAAPEAANNAAAQTSFIPTLTLGIPGDAVMALMLGAIMIHGITPGPSVMVEQPELFWGLVVSMLIGNLILLVLNIPLIGLWVRMLSIPYKFLYPPVILFICIGVFSVNNSVFDVLICCFFGVFGYALRKLECEPAPMLLAFILGPLMEENFRRALILSGGDFGTFFTRPISLVLLVISAILLVIIVRSMKSAKGSVDRDELQDTPESRQD